MKHLKIFFLIFYFFLLSSVCYSEPVKLKGEININTFYGAHLPLIDNLKKILKDENNFILFDTQQDWQFQIPLVKALLEGEIMENVAIKLGTAILSNNLISEPLCSQKSYLDYQNFRLNRFSLSNTLIPWQRFFILEDVQVTIIDKILNGGLIIGQQLIPFNFQDSTFLYPPVAIHPRFTPTTEYINYNIFSQDNIPYQNSTLTHDRDIGLTLYGNYPVFTFVTGVYNGNGSNTWDNNNAKDIFGRAAFPFGNYGEIGVSHRRGQNIVTKKFLSDEKIISERTQTGFQLRFGQPFIYIIGEYIFTNHRWDDSTGIDQTGWYASLIGMPASNTYLFGRYDTFMDNNPLKKIDDTGGYYKIQEITFGIKQNIKENVALQGEYSYTWENFDISDINKQASAQYGQFSINAKMVF